MSTPEQPKYLSPKKRKILVVDDHPVLCEGVLSCINKEVDLTVCATVRTPAQAIRELSEHQPDLIVVDLALREGHGLELIKEIRSQGSRVPILVFTMFEEDSYGVRSLKAGAQGYITKQQSPESLIAGIREALAGGYAVSKKTLTAFLASAGHPAPQPGLMAPASALRDRELEVFELMGEGLGTREIANRLGRSIKTVETYKARLKDKLHLSNATALMREAVRWIETQR